MREKLSVVLVVVFLLVIVSFALTPVGAFKKTFNVTSDYYGIPNGSFEKDPTGTSFSDISDWDHSSYDYYGATWDENLEIVDDYYFRGSKSLYSYIKSNTGTPLHDSCVYEYIWTEISARTTSDYISLWTSGEGYTTSSRYVWWIELIVTDGTNTYSERLRMKDVEPLHPVDYDNYNATETGADGRTWKRYTRRIPDSLDKSNLTIKIFHLQRSWDWTSTSSWYRLDDIYFSDSEGNGQHPVGGIWVPVDKFGLLAPYIGLASTIVVATVAAAIYAKRVKRREEKR